MVRLELTRSGLPGLGFEPTPENMNVHQEKRREVAAYAEQR
jgi:hypothetical protein